MKGKVIVTAPKAGEDVRVLHKPVARLCKLHNRLWSCAPDGFGVFRDSEEKVVLDVSESGVIVSGNLNGGVPGYATLLALKLPQPL